LQLIDNPSVNTPSGSVEQVLELTGFPFLHVLVEMFPNCSLDWMVPTGALLMSTSWYVMSLRAVVGQALLA